VAVEGFVIPQEASIHWEAAVDLVEVAGLEEDMARAEAMAEVTGRKTFIPLREAIPDQDTVLSLIPWPPWKRSTNSGPRPRL